MLSGTDPGRNEIPKSSHRMSSTGFKERINDLHSLRVEGSVPELLEEVLAFLGEEDTRRAVLVTPLVPERELVSGIWTK